MVCWVELPEQRRLCPIFCGNMDPDKWDTTMWYRVTLNPQEFHRLTGGQRDRRDRGVTITPKISSHGLINKPTVHLGTTQSITQNITTCYSIIAITYQHTSNTYSPRSVSGLSKTTIGIFPLSPSFWNQINGHSSPEHP